MKIFWSVEGLRMVGPLHRFVEAMHAVHVWCEDMPQAPDGEILELLTCEIMAQQEPCEVLLEPGHLFIHKRGCGQTYTQDQWAHLPAEPYTITSELTGGLVLGTKRTCAHCHSDMTLASTSVIKGEINERRE